MKDQMSNCGIETVESCQRSGGANMPSGRDRRLFENAHRCSKKKVPELTNAISCEVLEVYISIQSLRSMEIPVEAVFVAGQLGFPNNSPTSSAPTEAGGRRHSFVSPRLGSVSI